MEAGSTMITVHQIALRLAAAAAAAGALAGCTHATGVSAGRYSASGHGRVVALTTIDTLKARFNQANGHPRLVLIFSPT